MLFLVAQITITLTLLQYHHKARVPIITTPLKLGVLAVLLVPVHLSAVQNVRQNSYPCVAQKAEDHRVTLVVQRALFLGIDES